MPTMVVADSCGKPVIRAGPMEQYDNCYEICPYCLSQFGDADERLTDRETIQTCSNCGKKYLAWAEYSVDYCTEPIDD